ncbi:MAG TPA: hypothetical protein PK760_01020 [Flavobacteriales bacterium]|nr:hypothetical protein [Flavobacteriales bacterium]
MSRPKKEIPQHKPATPDEECIRVRLDRKTIVLLKSMRSFESWKLRYPDAEVIEVIAAKKKA